MSLSLPEIPMATLVLTAGHAPGAGTRQHVARLVP
jgi:hypothetical protein